jgi:hypothetical protein
MPEIQDDQRYKTSNLKSWMTQQQWSEYQALNAEFRSAYGGDFGNFDYYDYLNNDATRKNVDYFANNARDGSAGANANMVRRQQALSAMTEFFGRAGGGMYDFQKVDASGHFQDMQNEVGALAKQQRQQVGGDINRQYAGAQDRTKEALAGTGYGRSGVAVGAAAGIEQARASATAGAMEKITSQEMAVHQKIAFDESQFNIAQDLKEQGFDTQMIQDTLNFRRSMEMKNFEAALAYEPTSWWDTYGEPISAAVDVAAMFV